MISAVFLSNEKLSGYGRHLRGRSQSHRAAHHGNSLDGRGSSRETQTLQGSRYLPDDGAFIELVDDRIGDGPVVPATSEAGPV